MKKLSRALAAVSMVCVLPLGCATKGHGGATTEPCCEMTSATQKAVCCDAKGQTPKALAGGTATLPALEAIPAPARLAALRAIGAGNAVALTSSEFESRTVYDVSYKTESAKLGEVQVTSDGRTLYKSVEEENMDFANVPAAVREAAITRTGGITPKTVTRRTLSDREAFTFTVQIADATHQLTFDSAGSLLRESATVETAQVPVTVIAAMQQRFPYFKQKSVCEVRDAGVLYYLFDGGSEKKDLEATVLPSGAFRSVRLK